MPIYRRPDFLYSARRASISGWAEADRLGAPKSRTAPVWSAKNFARFSSSKACIPGGGKSELASFPVSVGSGNSLPHETGALGPSLEILDICTVAEIPSDSKSEGSIRHRRQRCGSHTRSIVQNPSVPVGAQPNHGLQPNWVEDRHRRCCSDVNRERNADAPKHEKLVWMRVASWPHPRVVRALCPRPNPRCGPLLGATSLSSDGLLTTSPSELIAGRPQRVLKPLEHPFSIRKKQHLIQG